MFVAKVSIPTPRHGGAVTFFLRFLQHPVLGSVEKVRLVLSELVLVQSG
jgi:hypothetical protein